ncbi:MAG: TonB-dependent receptor [Paludibacteraceae bacterium]|nr:TonB-dependent receptor [Paludibacteraceae bacterium]
MKKHLFIIGLFGLCPLWAAAQDSLSTAAPGSEYRLQEVDVVQRRKGVTHDRQSAFQTERIGTEELCRAACCNLSEAFETNASVDVSYSDAATGAKQIRLLGLSGTYVQMLTENTPGIRGLGQAFGMDYIPGPWMSSIQVSKGTSSVINGYEALTGQINVELLKPQLAEPLAVNAMLSSELHAEANLTGGWHITPQLSTGVLAHYQDMSLRMDHNHDGFLDMPTNRQGNVLNRWFYHNGRHTLQVLVRGLYDRRTGGQATDSITAATPYRIGLRTWRVEGFMKNGILFDDEGTQSIGIITAANYHNQHNTYGARTWQASQTNAYLNIIYRGVWDACDERAEQSHTLNAGLSLNYDRYREHIEGFGPAEQRVFDRWEATPGVFAEYTYKHEEDLSLIAGMRADWSSQYGLFATPRLNVRYSPWEWWTIRASAGLGYRTPNLLADNAAYLPTARQWHYEGIARAEQERALNAGGGMTFDIPMGNRTMQLTAEYYYTRFLSGLMTDIDADLHEVRFYNLSEQAGAQSFAQSAQIEASMEVLRGWTLLAAFRYTDTRQTTYNSAQAAWLLRERPLQNKYKVLLTTSYQTPLKKWQFDVTAQLNGDGRMPDGFRIPHMMHHDGAMALSTQYYTTDDGTVRYRMFPQLMAQVTRYFRHWSVYVGAENMTNFRQDAPIVAADAPWGTDFDASMVWAPTTGWHVYAGFRYALPGDDDL